MQKAYFCVFPIRSILNVCLCLIDIERHPDTDCKHQTFHDAWSMFWHLRLKVVNGVNQGFQSALTSPTANRSGSLRNPAWILVVWQRWWRGQMLISTFHSVQTPHQALVDLWCCFSSPFLLWKLLSLGLLDCCLLQDVNSQWCFSSLWWIVFPISTRWRDGRKDATTVNKRNDHFDSEAVVHNKEKGLAKKKKKSAVFKCGPTG